MTDNDRRYERVARFLDGAPIELTDQEHRIAEALRRDEAALVGRLDAAPPRRTMDRTRRRMQAELARPRWRGFRYAPRAAVAAAVAAAILALVWVGIESRSPAPSERPALAGNLFAEVYSRPENDIELDLIAEEIAGLETEILTSGPERPLVTELDTLERSLETFWLQDAAGMLGES